MNRYPNRKWTSSSIADGLDHPVETPDGKPLWHSHEPTIEDVKDRKDMADEYEQRFMERRGLE